MSSLTYCYQYPASMASQQNNQTSPQWSPEVQYGRRDSSPGAVSPFTHHRSHSLSAAHVSYNQEYLFPERQSRWSDARQELGLTRTLSQSRSPVRGGKIRMPIVEPASYDDGWVMPTRNHFVPLPAPDEHQRGTHSHRRRYSMASPVPSDGEWASSASRSTSPCSIASSRRSSRSSEKRVRFAEEISNEAGREMVNGKSLGIF